MKKLKAMLIHLLGGVTREEHEEDSQNITEIVRYSTACRIRDYMNLMHGMDADKWCKCAYDYVKRMEDEFLNKNKDNGTEI